MDSGDSFPPDVCNSCFPVPRRERSTAGQQEEGMFCEICGKYGKPPASACGAWTSKPVKNWIKATELLRQHEKSEYSLASVEVQAMSSLASTSGNNIMEQL